MRRPKDRATQCWMRCASTRNYDDGFDADRVRIARRSYYGLVSFLDHNIGLILDALEQAGVADTTRTIYSTDHGDNLGHRGFWGKSVMYDDSSALPLIAAGPDIPEGLTVETPVSLVDIGPTLMEFAGASAEPADADLPGESLALRFADPGADRAVFSEYHDWSSITGMFMLRTRDWKIVRYPGYDDQLFDMRADPQEKYDLAADPAHVATLNDMRTRLAGILDIEQVNDSAFAEQRAKNRGAWRRRCHPCRRRTGLHTSPSSARRAHRRPPRTLAPTRRSSSHRVGSKSSDCRAFQPNWLHFG